MNTPWFKKRTVKALSQFQPRLELLEDRWLPSSLESFGSSSFTVNVPLPEMLAVLAA
jgi:hypothetical protein